MKIIINDIAQKIGGAIVLSLVLSCIVLVWSDDKEFWQKIICTEVLLIVLMFLIDKGTENDTKPWAKPTHPNKSSSK